MKKILCAVAVIVIGAYLVCIGITFRSRNAAALLLRDFEHIKLGETKIADIRTMAAAYNRYRMASANPCSDSECTIVFRFDNRWLSRATFGSLTGLMCQIHTQNGRAVWLSAVMTSDAPAVASVQEALPAINSVPFDVAGKALGGGARHMSLIDVRMTPQASSDEEHAAFAFDLSCLTKVRGCKYSEEMLPLVADRMNKYADGMLRER